MWAFCMGGGSSLCANLDVELEVFVHGEYVFENVFCDPGDDAHSLGVVQLPLEAAERGKGHTHEKTSRCHLASGAQRWGGTVLSYEIKQPGPPERLNLAVVPLGVGGYFPESPVRETMTRTLKRIYEDNWEGDCVFVCVCVCACVCV